MNILSWSNIKNLSSSGPLTQNALAVIKSGANFNKSHKVFYYLPRVKFAQFHGYYWITMDVCVACFLSTANIYEKNNQC